MVQPTSGGDKSEKLCVASVRCRFGGHKLVIAVDIAITGSNLRLYARCEGWRGGAARLVGRRL